MVPTIPRYGSVSDQTAKGYNLQLVQRRFYPSSGVGVLFMNPPLLLALPIVIFDMITSFLLFVKYTPAYFFTVFVCSRKLTDIHINLSIFHPYFVTINDIRSFW